LFWFLVWCSPLASAGTVASFDDIEFWIGTGGQRAAMVVDWDDSTSSDESLAWGYRWTGTATGGDMLQAILEADNRLFAKLNASSTQVFGFGYDQNNDQQFAISDGSTFNASGITFGGVPDPPFAPGTASSSDAADHYAEGWYTGFWHYSVSISSAGGGASPFGAWSASNLGLAGRTLSDGDWDGWAFTPDTDPPHSAVAENPVAAESPHPADFDADFDTDGDVDGTDFLTWQRDLGEGALSEIDLQIWLATFGSGSTGSALQSTALVVPEPSCIAGAMWFFVLFFVRDSYLRDFFNK
jgi:hypothetical protein